MQNGENSLKIRCDSCGKEITRPEDGIIRWTWRDREGRLDRDSFAIVHRGKCDDRLDSSPRSGFHHIEHVQEDFDQFVDWVVLSIKAGLSRDDCEGLAQVLSRVNPASSYEALYSLFYETQTSAEARLNRHVVSIEGRMREISLTFASIKTHGLQPGAFEATLSDLRNSLLAKFGPTSPIMAQIDALEKRLSQLPNEVSLEEKCDIVRKFISAVDEYARSAAAAREFEALLGLEAVPATQLSHEAVYPSGRPYNAYKDIKGIMMEVSKKLIVVDPYVDSRLFSLLENVKTGVQIQILTRQMKGDFEVTGEKFRDQQGMLEVRKSGKLHDRFIVADENIFHIGASLKDAGTKLCAMSEFEGDDIKKTLRETISSYWDEAEIVL